MTVAEHLWYYKYQKKIVIQLLWLTIAPFIWVVSFCFLFTHVFFVVRLAVCSSVGMALCIPSVMSSLVGILKFTSLPCSFKKFESYCISLIHKLKQGLSFSQVLSTQTAASLDLPVLFFCCFQWDSEFWLEPAGISALLPAQLSKLFV